MNKHLIFGLLIILGANIVALAGVSYNRSGEPVYQLQLTERELSLPYMHPQDRENSRYSLSIQWRMPIQDDNAFYRYNTAMMVTDKDTIHKLGFAIDELGSANGMLTSQEVYVAFEFNGELYTRDITKVEKAIEDARQRLGDEPGATSENPLKQYTDDLKALQTSTTRLYFAGAAATHDELAVKYQGRSDIVVVRSLANVSYNKADNEYRLFIGNFLVPRVIVPNDLTSMFVDLYEQKKADDQPRYSVKVNWGKRLEPWIVEGESL